MIQHYGRPRRHTGQTEQTAHKVLLLGCAMLLGFFLCTLHTQEPEYGAEAVAVMQVQEMVAVPETDASVEPFGYLDGEWNFWEYIGDLLWSFLM